jgi:adenine/guanine/hypoxanthine permease
MEANKFMGNFLDRFFGIKKRGSSIRREILAGITTFLAMAYILPVNAGILSEAGVPFAAVLMATALSAAFATFIMAMYAKYPVALAPGMGVNAFFTYTVVFAMGFSWQMALSAVLVSGILFLIISLTGLRRIIINAVPRDLKTATGVGIGFFIAFIGFKNAGFIVIETGEFAPGIPQLGTLTSAPVALFIFGLFISAILFARKINGAIFYGMIITLLLGIFIGLFGVNGMPFISTGTSFSFSPLGETFGQGILAIPDLFGHPE